MTIQLNKYFRILVIGQENQFVADIIKRDLIEYFLVFEESCNRFPGFSYEVQGVYQVVEDNLIRFYTYVVKE